MPVFCLNSGSRYSNRPESCVEVVEATTIDLSCAKRAGAATTRRVHGAMSGGGSMDVRRFEHRGILHALMSCLDQQFAGDEFPRFLRARIGEKFRRRDRFRSAGRDAAARCRRPDVWPAPRSCVDITTLTPRAVTARTMSSIALVAAGSRLAVGSSRNSTAGSRASARASASRCCSPPDSRRAGRCSRPSSPTSASNSAARSLRAGRAARRPRRARSGHCRRRCAGA